MPTLRERVLAKDDSNTDVVQVPEWGESIRIRSLTALEQERWWDILTMHDEKGIDPPGGRKASLVYMGCIDDEGGDLFKPEDIPILGQKHPVAMNRLFSAIQKLSGMTTEVQADIEKKPDDQTNSSSTGSPTGTEGQTSTS